MIFITVSTKLVTFVHVDIHIKNSCAIGPGTQKRQAEQNRHATRTRLPSLCRYLPTKDLLSLVWLINAAYMTPIETGPTHSLKSWLRLDSRKPRIVIIAIDQSSFWCHPTWIIRLICDLSCPYGSLEYERDCLAVWKIISLYTAIRIANADFSNQFSNSCALEKPPLDHFGHL